MSDKRKYHRNKNGVWAECTATKRACRYGGDSVHEFFEGKPPVVNSTTDEVEDGKVEPVVEPVVEPAENSGNVFTITPNRRAAFMDRVEKANRKLERAGIEERFVVDFTERVVQDKESGEDFLVLDAKLNQPMISSGEWSFAGKIDFYFNENQDTIVTVSGPDEELAEKYHVDDPTRCDYCGAARRRVKTYIVRNKEGEYKQIGSNCLSAFLGVQPKGLWTLEYDMNELARDEEDYHAQLRLGSEYHLVDTKQIVALGLALTDNGKNYQGSNSSAPTKNFVANYLLGRYQGEPIDSGKYVSEAEKMMKETVFNASENYGKNMAALLKEEKIPFTKIGFVVSVIPAYLKQMDAYKKTITPKAKGFLGPVNTKISNVGPAVVERVTEFESNYGYYPSTSRSIKFRTADNKMVTWITGSSNDVISNLDRGDSVVLDAVTVKKHEEWQGEDQTLVKNVKLRLGKKADV